MSDICEIGKNWPFKCGFPSISQKFKGPTFCGGWVKELETLTKHLFWC